VVNQLGGTVRLQSRLGEGTTVELYLPRSEAAIEDEPETRVAPARSREAIVMVVDDDPDVRELTVACLDQLGYGIVEASSGAGALALLDGGQPLDLLIADFAMPGMNGRVLANEAKARRPGLRIVFVTGYADASALALEPDEILLSKPFKVAELARRIADALEQPVRIPLTDNVVPFGRGRSG
jgi:CheY-like chemotaxis protein